MARGISYQLNVLIRSLDDSRNMIFLHIDKKSQINFKQLFEPKNAQIKIVPRIEVNWAAYSLLQVELNLLKCATKIGHFEYYHLMSESDLPIKSNSQIHEFFKDKDSEFVDINNINAPKTLRRIRYYYPLQEKIGKKHGVLWAIQKLIMYGQIFFKVNRLKKTPNIKFGKGSQWFSITDDFARYILSKETELRKIFYMGQTVDELFVQTVLLNSSFENRIGSSNLRFIKWKNKNSPEVLSGSADLKEILASDDLFARKFDCRIDSKIVENILNKIKGF